MHALMSTMHVQAIHWTSCTNFITIWGNNRLSFVFGDMIDLLIVCYEWEDELLCPCLDYRGGMLIASCLCTDLVWKVLPVQHPELSENVAPDRSTVAS